MNRTQTNDKVVFCKVWMIQVGFLFVSTYDHFMNPHVFDATLWSRLKCSVWAFVSILAIVFVVWLVTRHAFQKCKFSLFYFFLISYFTEQSITWKIQFNIFSPVFSFKLWTHTAREQKKSTAPQFRLFSKFVSHSFKSNVNLKLQQFVFLLQLCFLLRSFCNISQCKNVRPHPIDSTRELIKWKWIKRCCFYVLIFILFLGILSLSVAIVST